MKRFLWGLLILCLVMPLGVAAQAKPQWTIIYYSAADTDLEQFMIGDLMEMQIVGSSQDVNVVVQMDRVEGYDQTNGTWTDARRFLLQKGDGSQPSSGDFQIDREAFITNLSSSDPANYGLTQDEFDNQVNALKSASQGEFEQFMLQGAAPLVGDNKPQGLQQTSIADVGEPAMGDPSSLSDFATWAIQTYPAEHYMLILSDHGGGWSGIAFDETSGNDPLSMRDLDTALAQTVADTGIGKFDVVAFDACLMGQLEVYNILAPYALYTIAAEEPIPGAGWEYITPMQSLVDQPTQDIPTFGKTLIDSYMNYYTNVMSGYPTFDLHLVDLTKIGAVNDALGSFINVVGANPANYIEAIGYARAAAQGFAQDNPDSAANFSSIDLADFMEKLKGYSDDPDIAAAADGVIAAAKDAVVYGAASKALPGATGLAIYFPSNVDDYNISDNKANYPGQVGEVMAPWISFLDVFHGTAETTYAPAKTGLKIDITQVIPSDYSASIYEPPTVIFDTDGSGVVDMQFYASLAIDGGMQVIVDAAALESAEYNENGDQQPPFPDGPQTSQFQWNVESPIVTDEKGNSELITLIDNKDNPGVSTVSGIYRPRSGKESEAYITFDTQTQTMTSVFGIQEGPVGQALGEIKEQPGDTFEPYYLVLDDKGVITRVPSGTQLVFSDKPFKYEFFPAPSGDYTLTIWMEDIAGNTVQDSVAFAIDNADLDAAWRGLKDIDSGISFIYPWSWGASTTTLYDAGGYKIDLQSADGTQFIGVDNFGADMNVASLDDVVNNAQDYIASIGTAGEPQTMTAGYEGFTHDVIVLPYTYTSTDNTERTGWMVLAYIDDNALGYQVDIDVRTTDEATGKDILDHVLSSLYFEPPTDTAAPVATPES